MHTYDRSRPVISGELEQALERFDWLIEQVRDEVHRSDIFEIQGVLDDPKARTAAIERALVVLGLLGTAEANAALKWFDPTGHHRRVRLLHRLAEHECRWRRHPSRHLRRGRARSGVDAPALRGVQ
jgi:hypothetical protein